MSRDDEFEDEERELDHLLERYDIPKRSLEISDEARRRTDAEAEIFLTRLTQSQTPRLRPRTRFLRVFVGAIALTAVALIAINVLVPGSSTPVAAATPPMLDFQFAQHDAPLTGRNPSKALDDLASAAEDRQETQLGGQVQEVRRIGWWLETTESGTALAKSKLVSTFSDHYFLPDGQVRLIESRGASLDPEGRIPSPPERTDAVISDETFEGPATGPTYAQDLPTEPAALGEHLLADAGEECDQFRTFCLTTAIMNLHSTYVIPPALDAAAWQLISTLTDVGYLGKAHDRLGREAEAFITPGSEPDRQIIIFADPDTGKFLGAETILAGGSSELGLEAPAVLDFTAIVDSRLLRSAPQ